MLRRPFIASSGSRWLALLPALVLVANAAIPVSAEDSIRLYSAAWVDSETTTQSLDLQGGTQTLTLRITNDGTSTENIGSISVTLPADFTLLPDESTGATVTITGFDIAPGDDEDIPIDVRASCLPNTDPATWVTAAQTGGSEPADFALADGPGNPTTTRTDASCELRFKNQPNTTKTNNVIQDGYNSTGDPLKVEIFDPETEDVVDTDAQVTITTGTNKAGGALTGDAVDAVNGTATFSTLSLDKAGTPYTLKADSDVATNTAETNKFTVADTVAKCNGAGCAFNQSSGGSSYTTTPKTGKNGATFVAALNLANVRVDCEFAPYNYRADRQPNSVWYIYDDGTTNQSYKTNVIVIPGNVVKRTSDNGASKYRVCYSSPVRFKDRLGHDAPIDTRPGNPTAYFGVNWYTGLLPDCVKKKPVPPCVMSWVGSGPDRVGTFLSPPGDPSYR
jgi:hypothetical protein